MCQAAGAETDVAAAALEELCQIYWRPVYCFLRRQGTAPHDAQDLTQGFFARFIASRGYARADRGKGRFRSFLLAALKNSVADERDWSRTAKRGGGSKPVELTEAAIAEAEALAARVPQESADLLFEREWTATILRRALHRLAEEWSLAGKAELFEGLRPRLSSSPDAEQAPYDELARRLRRSAVTLRSDVARLRARYRAILREEVAATVRESSDIDDELRYLRERIATR